MLFAFENASKIFKGINSKEKATLRKSLRLVFLASSSKVISPILYHISVLYAHARWHLLQFDTIER